MSFSLLESPIFILVDSRLPVGVILRVQVNPSSTTYDIGDEVKAWKAQQNTSTASDYWKTEGGQRKPSLLREFANAKTDDERAGVLARSSYPNRNPRQNSDFVYAGDKDYKPGQLVRTDTFFGRVNRIVTRPK